MRLLLDTHVLLWWLFGLPRLGDTARTAIVSPGNDVHVSSVTGYEIRFKKALGKLDAPDDLRERLATDGFRDLPLTMAHAADAGDLPVHHRDPFDRMLVAQARAEGLTLVTSDRQLSAYDVPVLYAGS